MGLRVAVVDGTTVSMPDTAKNQAIWPQPSIQKPGCGFPVMKLVGLFSLATGTVQTLITGTLHNAEHALFVHLWSALTAGFDLLLGDRLFGSFATFCALRLSGLHGVFRLHQRRKIDWRKGGGASGSTTGWSCGISLPSCRGGSRSLSPIPLQSEF